MRIKKPSHISERKAQTAVEYMLLLGTVVAITLVGFKTYLPQTQNAASLYFNRAAVGIMGGEYQHDAIDGGWCEYEPDCPDCGYSLQTRECSCPAPAFGGLDCPFSDPDGDGNSATRRCQIPCCGDECATLCVNSCEDVFEPCSGTTCDCAQVCDDNLGPNWQCLDGACICIQDTWADACNGIECGTAPDGCGGEFDCSFNCTAQGTRHSCDENDVCICDADSCSDLGYTCGTGYDNGCGGVTGNCGTCNAGPNDQCVNGHCQCTPDDCDSLGHSCGDWADGCGGTTGSCGTCDLGSNDTCVAGECQCIPDECFTLGYECGSGYNDGCGGTLNCGDCSSIGSNATCDSGGQCQCDPDTCSSLGKSCGVWDDGCGGTTGDCGDCTVGGTIPNATCDSGGQCQCTPDSCASAGYECGSWDDGCGGSTGLCGTCTAGVNDECVDGTCQCVPDDCGALCGANCNMSLDDGCGNECVCDCSYGDDPCCNMSSNMCVPENPGNCSESDIEIDCTLYNSNQSDCDNAVFSGCVGACRWDAEKSECRQRKCTSLSGPTCASKCYCSWTEPSCPPA